METQHPQKITIVNGPEHKNTTSLHLCFSRYNLNLYLTVSKQSGIGNKEGVLIIGRKCGHFTQKHGSGPLLGVKKTLNKWFVGFKMQILEVFINTRQIKEGFQTAL